MTGVPATSGRLPPHGEAAEGSGSNSESSTRATSPFGRFEIDQFRKANRPDAWIARITSRSPGVRSHSKRTGKTFDPWVFFRLDQFANTRSDRDVPGDPVESGSSVRTDHSIGFPESGFFRFLCRKLEPSGLPGGRRGISSPSANSSRSCGGGPINSRMERTPSSSSSSS